MGTGSKVSFSLNIILILLIVVGAYIGRDIYYDNIRLNLDIEKTNKIAIQNAQSEKDETTKYINLYNESVFTRLTMSKDFKDLEIKYGRLYNEYNKTNNDLLYVNLINSQLKDSLIRLNGIFNIIIDNDGKYFVNFEEPFEYLNDTLTFGGKLNIDIDVTKDGKFIVKTRPTNSSLWYNMELNLISTLEYNYENNLLFNTIKSSIDTNNCNINVVSNINPDLLKKYYDINENIYVTGNEKQPRLSAGVQLGYGFGHDLYNSQFCPAVIYLGFGVNFKIIEF